MFFLVLSFLAGVLSVFAACILPLLPVIVGGSLATGSRKRMYTIVASLAISIIGFTLLLKASTVLIGIPESAWAYISGSIITILGIFILFPNLWVKVPGVNLLNRSSNKLLATGYQEGGFWGDVVMGAALGPVFASCSPTYFIILATVLPAQPALGLIYLAAYAAGLALALLLIAILGEKLIQRLGVTLDPNGKFFKTIGVILILVGILVLTGYMKKVEAWFVERGYDATFIELKLLGADKETAPANMDTKFVLPDMKASMYQKAPELARPGEFVNSEPFALQDLIGKKVILIDFWTYSCINCQRTFPYLKAWHDEYSDEGLVIVGVHTPEFAFERVTENVVDAAMRFGLKHPIVLDNEYATWRAFGNNYWPRKYLIDIDGYIVYDHIGEGAYEETERAIQRALAERAERLGSEMPSTAIVSPEEEARGGLRSPEVYFGALRNEFLGNGSQRTVGSQTFVVPNSIIPNTLYLGGTWNIGEEYAENEKQGATVTFKYVAKDVYFVARSDAPVRIKVTRDGGKPLGNARGEDVSEDGYVTVQESRLYKLIEDVQSGVHTLEIHIEEGGLEAYTFTFG
ncbi:cytochrome c biogenesis protein DipZ [Candidatus Parcubacteria bacterium]|nr:MAG: cytochrome c biogenesis protein DipZ [Candidatus Parcubacteria bacterium]